MTAVAAVEPWPGPLSSGGAGLNLPLAGPSSVCSFSAELEGVSLKDEVVNLKTEVSRLGMELISQRDLLRQCLQVRDAVSELIQDRETLTQCLELFNDLQDLRSSSKQLAELGERTTELDLSVA